MKPFNARKAAVARLLQPLWWCLGQVITRRPSVQPPRSILILDLHLIGDIVLLTPLLRSMREHHPDAHIALLAGPWAGEILAGTGWVNEIIPFAAPWVNYDQGWHGWKQCVALVQRLRGREWHLGVEVRGDVRQILLLVLAGAQRRVGYPFTGGRQLLTDVVPDDGSLAPLADHHRRIAEYLGIWPANAPYLPVLQLTRAEAASARQQERYYGFHFGASLPLRRLPEEESLRLVRRVSEHSTTPLILFVPPDDPDSAQRLYDALPSHLRQRIHLWSGTLRGMIVLLNRAMHLYCMDSGSAHIAAALGVPVTVIYGPADSRYVRPPGAHVTVIERSDLACKPCDQRHCTNSRRQCCLAGLVDTIPTGTDV